jgi:hypothetical protein
MNVVGSPLRQNIFYLDKYFYYRKIHQLLCKTLIIAPVCGGVRNHCLRQLSTQISSQRLRIVERLPRENLSAQDGSLSFCFMLIAFLFYKKRPAGFIKQVY